METIGLIWIFSSILAIALVVIFLTLAAAHETSRRISTLTAHLKKPATNHNAIMALLLLANLDGRISKRRFEQLKRKVEVRYSEIKTQ